MDNYYQTLELQQGAAPEEIKSNYRRLAMKWHPDRNSGSPEAEEKFKSISEAYSVLSDEGKRRDYDAFLSGGGAERGERAYARPRRDFSPEEAAAMFMNEMYNLASELTMMNVRWQDIAQELMRRGCPEDVAKDIAKKIETRRKALIRASARPYFVRSAISGAFGLGLFATFAGVGFGFLGLIGFFLTLSGGYNLVRALYFFVTGKAPSA
jgi:curved DNA-binding protein CbpA